MSDIDLDNTQSKPNDTSSTVAEVATKEVEPEMRRMMDAGVFYGRIKSRTNPKMKQFVVANRNGIDVINLEKTAEMLQSAKKFLDEVISSGGEVLVVGTQPIIRDKVQEAAKEAELPVVTNRWLGGTLTNFGVISARVEYLKQLRGDYERGEFESYTKKEQLDISREIEKLELLLGGIENLSRPPAVVLIIDPVVHKTVAREARKLNIPIVALVNTDVNPSDVEYPILGNTRSKESLEWFLDEIMPVIHSARKKAVKTAQESKTNEKEDKKTGRRPKKTGGTEGMQIK